MFSPDTNGATQQKLMEPIINSIAVYTGCGNSNSKLLPRSISDILKGISRPQIHQYNR